MGHLVAPAMAPGEVGRPGDVGVAAGACKDPVEGLSKPGELFWVPRDEEIVVLLAPVRASSPPAEGPYARGRPVRRAGPEVFSVDGEGLEVHDIARGVLLDEDRDHLLTGPRGKKKSRLVAPVVELCPVAVDPDPDPSFGRADKGLCDGTVGEGIHGDVDPRTGMVDEAHIERLEVLLGRVVLAQVAPGEGSVRGKRARVPPPAGAVPPLPRPGAGCGREEECCRKEDSEDDPEPKGEGRELFGSAMRRDSRGKAFLFGGLGHGISF